MLTKMTRLFPSTHTHLLQLTSLLKNNLISVSRLQISEIQAKLEFDQNKDGVVSEEEVKFFMESQEEMPWENFVTEGWPRMKPFLMLDRGVFTAPEQEEEEPENTQHDEDSDHHYESEEPELEEEQDVPEETEVFIFF